MQDLGTFGGDYSMPADINASGQVAGYANNASGDARAFAEKYGLDGLERAYVFTPAVANQPARSIA